VALPITTTLAAVLALILIWLAWATIALRFKTRSTIGDGGNDDLQRAIRGHGNFIEYAPLALILIALLEYQNAPDSLVITLASVFAAARLAHPIGMRKRYDPNMFRVGGTLGTLLVLLIGAGYALAMTWL